jgi:histidyl-tRNA synthetase
LEINSVGNQSDRTAYREALIQFLTPHKDDLDADSQDRLTRNPLRILDSKDPKTKAIVQDAPQLLDYLSDASRHHFEQVQAMLTALGIDYRINPRLVRGLDYYTHTAFEIQSHDLGAQATVCGGGRYDGLVSELGGPATPAVGWAMGVERLILLLEQLSGDEAPTAAAQVYLVSQGDRATAQGMQLAQALRQEGLRVEFDLSGAAFKKQFKRADRSGASLCLVLGESEAEAGTVGLKWLKTQEQTQQSQADLLGSLATLKQRLTEGTMEQG